MDIDQVFHLVGEIGPQQILYFTYTAIIGGLFVSGEMLQIVFTGAKPEFQCWNGSKPSTAGCDANGQCEYPHYTSRFTSLPTEWDLICNKEYLVKMVQAVFMAGVMLGAFVFGYISDRFGRRRTMPFTAIAMSAMTFFGAFAPSLALHVACRFFAGMTTAAVALVSFVLMTELVGPSKRALLGTLFPAVFSVGIGLHAALAYAITDWRHYSIATALLSALFIPLALLLPESPRWLLLHGQRAQARQVLLDIALRNGRVHCLPRTWDLQEPKVHHKGSNPVTLFTSRTLRIRTLIQIFLWLVNGITYYALTMAAGDMGGNLYISTALSGLIELPGYLLSAFLLSYVGRRNSLCAVMLIGSGASIALQFAGHFHYTTALRNILSLAAKMCISMSFAIIYVYSAELLPTIVRNVGMGIVSVAARIGGILSPFVSLLDNLIPGLQFTVLGAIMLLTGLSALALPETLGHHLPETIEEIEDEDKRPLLSPTTSGVFTRVSVDEGIAEAAASSSEDELYSVHQRPAVSYSS
uniref:Putative sugar transporter n=1 Tax=Amblyomma aureolatum TaxID=187763 RepID=A0A1E1XCU6_9ACAR